LSFDFIDGYAGAVSDTFEVMSYTSSTGVAGDFAVSAPPGYTMSLSDTGTVLEATIDTVNFVVWDGNDDLDGGDDVNWNDPLNWDTNSVPGATDIVVVDGANVTVSSLQNVTRLYLQNGATVTVTGSGDLTVSGYSFVDATSVLIINGGTFEAGTTTGDIGQWDGVVNVLGSGGVLDIKGAVDVANLAVAGSTLTGSGSLTVEAGGNFNFGFNSTIGGSIILETQAGSTTDLTDNNDATLTDTVVWNNAGTVNWIGGANDNFNIGATAVFNNLAGGVFDIATTADTAYVTGAGTFNNLGTVQKTTAFTAQIINTVFDNDGAVDVQMGSLEFAGDGDASGDDGDYTVAAGATLIFDGHSRTWNFGSSITGLGTVQFQGNGVSNFNMGGVYNVAGTTDVAFSGVDNLVFSGTVSSIGVTYQQSGSTTSSVVTFSADISTAFDATEAFLVNGGTLAGSGTLTLGTGDSFTFGNNSYIARHRDPGRVGHDAGRNR